ncbi:MAG: NAD(P)H-binding protein [Anaerolineae bacterium]
MMQKKILVLGGTGMLGQPVARRLKEEGYQVRVLVRDVEKARKLLDASFETVQGDVTDPGSLERAMEGCHGVHISVGGPVDQLSAENVAALAPKLGLERITYISGATAFEQNRWFPVTEQKLNAEKAIRECGVPYTIFCPTWPMEQLPRFAREGQPFLIGKQPSPLHWFAADDLARMVSTAYQREEAANKRFFVHGPEAKTMKQALEQYCQALYPDGKKVSVMPIWLAKVMALLTRNQMLKFASDLMAYFDRIGEMGDPTEANQLLGAPTITLDEWIKGRQAETIEKENLL